MHTFVHQKIFTKIFIVALFLVAQDWKQPKYLPIVEWVNCRIVIAISKQTQLHTTEWMNLTKTILSE